MGFLYLLISPIGKPYVGQTIGTVEHRWDQHRQSANRDDNSGCLLLNNAIRKYGFESFTKETIMKCDDCDLNELEALYIQKYNSLTPNGYNISKGGAGCVYVQTPEIKAKRSKSLRKEGNEDLPMYIKTRKTKYSEGYIIAKPGFKSVQFCSPNMTMGEKLELAKKYLIDMDNGIYPRLDLRRRNDLDIELPEYVSYIKRSDGFRVKKPGCPLKEFQAKSETQERKLERALEYLATLE